MAEPFSWTALAISVAAAAASAASSIQQGQAAKKNAQFQAAQYEEEADRAKTMAIQDETNRRRALAETLGAQEAIRAGRGVELYGGTGDAIREATTDAAESDILSSRANILGQAGRFSLAAQQARQAGSDAAKSGYFKAGASLLSAAGSFKAPRGSVDSSASLNAYTNPDL